jgi:hypothetical protein
MENEQAVTDPLPPVPRPITARAASRAWAEQSVQMWWKSALAVAIVMAGVTAMQLRDHLRRKNLLEHGLPVKATVIELDGRKISTGSFQPMRDVELPVKLRGTLPDGRPFEFDGNLPTAEGKAQLGADLDLRVDPQDHSRWIEVGKQRPLTQTLMAVYLLLPVVFLLLALAWWRRNGVLKVWENGRLREAVVVDCRHSPLAPRSRVCRYTLADGEDRRVFQTLYPTRLGVPQRGDVLHMLVLHDQPGRAVVADLYVREVTT